MEARVWVCSIIWGLLYELELSVCKSIQDVVHCIKLSIPVYIIYGTSSLWRRALSHHRASVAQFSLFCRGDIPNLPKLRCSCQKMGSFFCVSCLHMASAGRAPYPAFQPTPVQPDITLDASGRGSCGKPFLVRRETTRVCRECKAKAVGCFTARTEIAKRSPSYMKALEEGRLPCRVLEFGHAGLWRAR